MSAGARPRPPGSRAGVAGPSPLPGAAPGWPRVAPGPRGRPHLLPRCQASGCSPRPSPGRSPRRGARPGPLFPRRSSAPAARPPARASARLCLACTPGPLRVPSLDLSRSIASIPRPRPSPGLTPSPAPVLPRRSPPPPAAFVSTAATLPPCLAPAQGLWGSSCDPRPWQYSFRRYFPSKIYNFSLPPLPGPHCVALASLELIT